MVQSEYLPAEKQVKYDKESLVLHEAVPGHIFQITLAHAQENQPDIRKFYHNSAFVEGWALYADPYSRFGQLAKEGFRAVRLVVTPECTNLAGRAPKL